jgi:hypothetical protein
LIQQRRANRGVDVRTRTSTGRALGDRAAELLQGDAAFLHVHFAGPGCFAFRIDPV